MEQSRAELLKEAAVIRSFLSSRLDEFKNWRRSEQLLDEVHRVFIEEVNFLESVEKQVEAGKSAIATLEAKKAELEASIRPLKAQQAAGKESLARVLEEKGREVSKLDEMIGAREKKLSALDEAIKEKAGALGGLIARELV
jgi:septal ring factor EnvC (AmiA/AmiB activator)